MPTDKKIEMVLSVDLAEYWGKRVLAAREAAGLRQSQLAKACGVEQQTISKIENAKLVPSDRHKFILATRLNVPVDDLFRWPEGMSVKVEAA